LQGVIPVKAAEAVQVSFQRILVLSKELSTAVGSIAKVIMKLIGPREVGVRCEEHAVRILRFVLKKEGSEIGY